MSPENSDQDHSWSKPIWEIMVPVWELVVHVIVGSVLFALIFTPAVILDLLIEWLKGRLSEFLATLLTWTKYSVAVIDVVLYLALLIAVGALFLRSLWRLVVQSWRPGRD